MYKPAKLIRTSIDRNKAYVGETLEGKIRRIVNNKEPITDGAPLIYTERKDGVMPEYDIRTDRFEIAIDAMDKVTTAKIAKRQATIGEQAKEGMAKEGMAKESKIGGEPTSIEATK